MSEMVAFTALTLQQSEYIVFLAVDLFPPVSEVT